MPLAARGGPAAIQAPGRRSGLSGTDTFRLDRELGVCPRTGPPPGNAGASGLTRRLESLCEGRRVTPDEGLACARRHPPSDELSHPAGVRTRGGRRQDPSARLFRDDSTYGALGSSGHEPDPLLRSALDHSPARADRFHEENSRTSGRNGAGDVSFRQANGRLDALGRRQVGKEGRLRRVGEWLLEPRSAGSPHLAQ